MMNSRVKEFAVLAISLSIVISIGETNRSLAASINSGVIAWVASVDSQKGVLPVYAEASEDSAMIGSLKRCTKVALTGNEKDSWVELSEPVVGWVDSNLLSMNSAVCSEKRVASHSARPSGSVSTESVYVSDVWEPQVFADPVYWNPTYWVPSHWVSGHYEGQHWVPGHWHNGHWIPGHWTGGHWVPGHYEPGHWELASMHKGKNAQNLPAKKLGNPTNKQKSLALSKLIKSNLNKQKQSGLSKIADSSLAKKDGIKNLKASSLNTLGNYARNRKFTNLHKQGDQTFAKSSNFMATKFQASHFHGTGTKRR